MIRIFILIAFAIVFNINTNLNASNMENKLTLLQEKTVTISAFAAKGELNKLSIELNAGLDAGLTVNETKEVLVHLYAYCGFPRSLQGLLTLMDVLEQRKTKGINDNWGREATPITDNGNKYDRGKKILAEITGVPAPEGRLTTGFSGFSPEIETFLKEHLFADIFERDVLTYAQREIVTVSVLMSIGGVDPMLNSHMNISLNVGISPSQLKEMIQIIDVNIGKDEGSAAQSILSNVLENRNIN